MPDSRKMAAQRDELVYQQRGLCAYCDRPFGSDGGFRRPTLDHVVPLALGGSNTKDNKVAACAECNTQKGHMSAEAFKAKLKSNREQAESLSQALRRSVAAIGETS